MIERDAPGGVHRAAAGQRARRGALIADDDLLALPVVDDEGKLLGIVTVDDAIDVILPTAWKKRIPAPSTSRREAQ